MVLGAGPVGLLGAMALARDGFRTVVYSREKEGGAKDALVRSFGGTYVSTEATPPAALPLPKIPIPVEQSDSYHVYIIVTGLFQVITRKKSQTS